MVGVEWDGVRGAARPDSATCAEVYVTSLKGETFVLAGKPLDHNSAYEAGRAAFAAAVVRPGNRYKVELGKRALACALLAAAALEP